MTSQPTKLYDILGVTTTASTEEIRKAYRQKCLECHPDRNPGDPSAEERFKDIANAHEILSDSNKRLMYNISGDPDSSSAGFTGADVGGDLISSIRTVFDFIETSPLFAHYDVPRPDLWKTDAPGPRAKPKPKPKRPKADRSASAKMRRKSERRAKKTQEKTAKAKKSDLPNACMECHGVGEINIVQAGFSISVPCACKRMAGTA